MNLHAIASPLVAAVNPNVTGTLRDNQGYTTTAAGKREPVYGETTGVLMQVQALAGPELALVDGLNIQGVKRAVYLFGDVQGVVRPDAKGGDILLFSDRVWLVIAVLETWGVAEWCKVAVVLQESTAPPPPPPGGLPVWQAIEW